MRFVDEYRDPAAARALVAHITELAGDGHFKFMEVCGGHTHTIYRHGIEHVLPANVELVHGPGCPVCVIPMGRIDDAIAVAETPGAIFTSFGDMMRVPGGKATCSRPRPGRRRPLRLLAPRRAEDRQRHPDRDVVFFAVGFETTAPSTAVTLLRARDLGVTNFNVFCNHVTIVPPIKAILESPDLRLDGFLGPGHVSTVVGNRPYRFVPEQYGKPLVTAGFEPLDILQAIAMLLAQIREGRCEVENQYTRVVRDEGNPRALEVLAEVFELRPHFEWRGLGFISQSALKLRPEFAAFDAELPTPCPVCGWPTPRPASAARCSRASSSRGSARCSAPPARPRRRSAPAWCRRRAPAPPTTTSAGCTARWRSASAAPAEDRHPNPTVLRPYTRPGARHGPAPRVRARRPRGRGPCGRGPRRCRGG